MAKLNGYWMNNSDAPAELEILPILPLNEKSEEAYSVNIVFEGENGKAEYKLTYFYDAEYVEKLAGVLMRIEAVVDAYIDLSTTPQEKEKFKMRVKVKAGPRWFYTFISGWRKHNGKKIIRIEFFLSGDPINIVSSTSSEDFSPLGFGLIHAELADVKNFGETLLKECLAAKQERIRLGIEEPEDDVE